MLLRLEPQARLQLLTIQPLAVKDTLLPLDTALVRHRGLRAEILGL